MSLGTLRQFASGILLLPPSGRQGAHRFGFRHLKDHRPQAGYRVIVTESVRKIMRLPERSVTDRREVYSILDQGFVAHIGFADPDSSEPTVIPVAYARDQDRILFHGSTGSRLFMHLRNGASVCATITLVDGIVAARSAFNSSMNYRSAMVFGRTRAIEAEEKVNGLQLVTERLIPGLWDVSRNHSTKEYAQTMLIELPLDDVTAKSRTGGPKDTEDAHLPIWAGYVPMHTSYGEPVTNDDSLHIPVPDYIKNLGRDLAE